MDFESETALIRAAKKYNESIKDAETKATEWRKGRLTIVELKSSIDYREIKAQELLKRARDIE